MTSNEKRFWKLIGHNIKAARKRAGLTQEDVAASVGCSRPHIPNMEKGICGTGLFMLFKLATVFGCGIVELVAGVRAHLPVLPSQRAIRQRKIKAQISALESRLKHLRKRA